MARGEGAAGGVSVSGAGGAIGATMTAELPALLGVSAAGAVEPYCGMGAGAAGDDGNVWSGVTAATGAGGGKVCSGGTAATGAGGGKAWSGVTAATGAGGSGGGGGG